MNCNIETMAAALYDGGWRSVDCDEIEAYYEITRAQAEEICEYLARYEEA